MPATPQHPPRVLIAPDSFKGSLDQVAVAEAIADGMRRRWPAAAITTLPVSDGGEGWVTALVRATGGRLVTRTVGGPLGEPVEATFGLLGDGRTAVLEVAGASGLQLLDPSPATAVVATSRGTGELIAEALASGARRILLGLGGSATTEGGAGLAAALGARLLDARGEAVGDGGAAAAAVEDVDLELVRERLRDVEIVAACDVRNPLLGPQGAAAVYGPQKGAGPDEVARLDAALAHLADRVEAAIGRRLRDVEGAGAAGGIAWGLMAMCGASVRSGIEITLDAVGFDALLEEVELVVTGEGRIDAQTLEGKVVAGVAARAVRRGVPVVALGGALDASAVDPFDAFEAAGVSAALPTLDAPTTDVEALSPKATVARLRRAGERLARVLDLGVALGSPSRTPEAPASDVVVKRPTV